MTTKGLIVDENAGHRNTLSELLVREGIQAHEAGTFENANRMIQEDRFDIVIIDLGPTQPRGRVGLLLTEEIKKRAPATQIVIVYRGPISWGCRRSHAQRGE